MAFLFILNYVRYDITKYLLIHDMYSQQENETSNQILKRRDKINDLHTFQVVNGSDVHAKNLQI